MRLAEVARATGGRLLIGSPEAFLPEVSIDSRSITREQMFMPLTGERFRGQDFVLDVIDKGAAGVFTEEWHDSLRSHVERSAHIKAVVEVASGNQALMDTARLARGTSGAKTIAITGSSGKTSTKNLLAGALSMESKVHASPANYNNEVGVPLTIIKAPADVDFLVLELGMRGAGQIRELAMMAAPDIGVITNVGEAHLGLLGSRENLAAAKAELLEALPDQGVAILNADDGYAPVLARFCRAAVLTFGLSERADFRATDVHLDEEARPTFVLRTPTEECEIALRVSGAHSVTNALAAAAAAVAAGASLAGVQRGLALVEPESMRLQTYEIGEVKIINDCYNANPASVIAALATLRDTRAPGRRVAVLGDMAELGEHTREAHLRVGEAAAAMGVDLLIGVGVLARDILDGAVEAGMSGGDCQWFSDVNEAGEALAALARPGDLVLLKGSRVMGLERLVDRLKAEG